MGVRPPRCKMDAIKTDQGLRLFCVPAGPALSLGGQSDGQGPKPLGAQKSSCILVYMYYYIVYILLAHTSKPMGKGVCIEV